MGKDTKLTSTGHGQPIAEGWVVAPTQMLVHDPLGCIAYHWPIHWGLHVNIAQAAYERVVAIQERIAKIAPGADKIRLVFDEPLLVDAYDAGTSMVSNAVRSVRHLAEEIARSNGSPLTPGRVADKIAEATAAVGIDSRTEQPCYQGLAEIIGVRGAIEHPDSTNVYQAGAGWDRVPLAWILSDRSTKAYTRYREWIGAIAADWSAWLDSRAEPATLTVERGMRSRYSAKKTPTSPLDRNGQ
jgi:hypothetical protein